MTFLTLLWHWILANPYETLLLIGAAVSFINGLLPAKVAAGRVGKVFNEVIDRLSALTRRDAPGTLKWPVVGTSLLQSLKDTPPATPPPAPTAPTQESTK